MALEMYLCHDCKTEYEDADEVIHFADWFPDDEDDDIEGQKGIAP